MARGKQKVVILFDDMSRPTPVQKILPFVIKELEEEGVGTDKIRLVCATGCHRPLSRQEFIAKLVWQSEDGMVPHFLQGTFGSDYGGRDWHKPGPLRTSQAKRLFIYSENLSKQERLWWGPEDQVFWFRDWQELIASLKVRHGTGTRVGIYPYCTLQCPPLCDEQ